MNSRITCLGETNFRNHRRRFGIKRADRRAHTYIIGKTGTGKSTLIGNLARQDIVHDEGLAILDPHGDLVEELVRLVPEERKSDLIYFNATDSCTLGPVHTGRVIITSLSTRLIVLSTREYSRKSFRGADAETRCVTIWAFRKPRVADIPTSAG
jgi:ABC-type cobalamin/Fe3+-siderophores transport system ATPase subunit